MAGKLSDLTDHELMVIQKTGIDADNFIRANELFVNHLKPALEVERERAKSDGDWAPGRATDLEVIALFNSFNSGKRAGLKMLETICTKIVNRGIDAGLELERRKKRKV